MTESKATNDWEPTPEMIAEVDIEQLRELRSLTPTERLIRHEGAFQLVRALREAGKRHYGFDPAIVAQVGREGKSPE